MRSRWRRRSARAEAAEAAALARQAAAYPNPSVSASHEPLSDGDRSYSETYLNLSQRLEWPGTRSARQDAAARIAAAAAARLSADSARLAFEVKQAYTAAARAERVEQVLTRVTEVFRTGERSAQERYAAGDISLYERRRIAVERARLRAPRRSGELLRGRGDEQGQLAPGRRAGQEEIARGAPADRGDHGDHDKGNTSYFPRPVPLLTTRVTTHMFNP